MKYIKYILFAGLVGTMSSCVSDLLDRQPTTEVSSDLFWKSTDDALSSTYGVYNAIRDLYATDYYYDGQGEFQNTRGKSIGSITGWSPAAWVTSGFSSMWNNAYKTINRANFTIQNIERMIEIEGNATTRTSLERINAENYFLRALAYFRLIENWGDVPYYRHVLSGDAEACSLERIPIATIKDDILQDLQYAYEKLPASVSGGEAGRATQVAALAFKGKIELYWASWKKNGWPELKDFQQSTSEAQEYYKRAAADFKKVIYDYDLKLFGNGDPGEYQTPNYWKLFQYDNEYCQEIIFSLQYGGPNLGDGQGESLLRDFGTRSTANAQCWIMPTNRLVNRYQSTVTGDFLPELILNNQENQENGAWNRKSYENRDWRMRSTILWNGEKMIKVALDGMSIGDSLTWMFGVRGEESKGFINNDASSQTGYIYRKWVRQVGIAERTQGPQDFYLMRLADVYLMYCEAVNETDGPSQELVGLINQIRNRGNLPGLKESKYANKEEFFKAIEQERIVELATEGHRPFDIRRWRKVNEIWGEPNSDGQTLYDTKGTRLRDEFKNASERDFQKYYIYQIPEGERSRNPKLAQNTPWY